MSLGPKFVGKASWFGGPNDAMAGSKTASGVGTNVPGVAVRPGATYMSGKPYLGGYWRITAPNGRSVVIKQTDIGPNESTGRQIDITYSALGKFGYTTKNFPTDSHFHAEYLGKKPVSTRGFSPGGAVATTSAYNPAAEANNRAALLTYAQNRRFGGGSNLLGLQQTLQSNAAVSKPAVAKTFPSSSPSGSNTSDTGVTNFEGKQVAAWIAPILRFARQRGWQGSVTSGYRTLADQTKIYNSGIRPAAKPGTSNHEMTAFPGGAIDVSNPAQLSHILAGTKYAGLLVWAGSKDPVHFSHPHNGSY